MNEIPRRAFILALILCIALAATLAAQPSQPSTLIMVTEVWPPYRMDSASSASGFTGIDIDLCLALEKRLGIRIDIQRVPWARALDMMRSGQADLITGIARTSERELYLHYLPTSYSVVRPMFFAPKGQGSLIRSYEDLYGKAIGMSTHSAYFPRFNADKGLNKQSLSAEVQILQMLALKRIDLAIGTDPNLGWDIARLGLKDAVEPTAWQPEERTELFLAISRKSSAAMLVERMDAALRAMIADGSMEAIQAAYR
jgi:polar amino acid transport system substrate-binding protein